jgi:hypothetical protein
MLMWAMEGMGQTRGRWTSDTAEELESLETGSQIIRHTWKTLQVVRYLHRPAVALYLSGEPWITDSGKI